MKSILNIQSIVKSHLVVIFFLLCCSLAFGQDASSLTVIGNQKGAPSSLKISELKVLFKGEKQRWPDGTKVVIALMKTGTPIGQNSAKKIYNMSGDELNRFWLALVFQGKATAPNFFNSVSELETFVAQTPGAIGVITNHTNTETKTITVDGNKEF
jgi:hypothetical protein